MHIDTLSLVIIFFLIMLQSIVGVGILVVGTPLLLILNFDLPEILKILLPISIATSALNLIYYTKNQKKIKSNIEKDYKYLFFFVCIPSIFIGLYILKIFNGIINFKLIVSMVIILSFFLTRNSKIINKITNKFKFFSLFVIGIMHGVTNSGGTLLSLFFTGFLKKEQSRYNVSYFYFFIALFQFCIYLIIFNPTIILKDYFEFFLVIPFAVISGNKVLIFFNEKQFKSLASILALAAAVLLLTLH